MMATSSSCACASASERRDRGARHPARRHASRPRPSGSSRPRARTTASTTDTSFDVILLDAEAVGRLYVARWTGELRNVDIALLPEVCNGGMGTTLLRELQAEAAAAGKPLRIHVERFNPALRLYERLGFRLIEDRGVYLFLEWKG